MHAAFALSLILALGSAPDLEGDEAIAPVIVDGVRLFAVRGFSTLPAGARALRIRDRIAAAAAEPAITPADVRIIEGPVGSEIHAGPHRVMIVSDADAEVERVPRPVAANVARDAIVSAIARWRADREPAAIQKGILQALAIAASLLALLLLVLVLGRRFDALMEQRVHRRIHHVQIESYKLIDAEMIWRALRAGLRTAVVLFVLGAGIFAVGLALRQFPWTRGAAENLLAVALTPVLVIARGFARAFPNLVFLAVLTVIVRWLLKAARLFFEAVKNETVKLGGFDPLWAIPTYGLVRIALIGFALIVAYPYIPGSGSEAFKAISIFAGIVFSLGSSSIIASIIAGYAMSYRRTFRIGDRVQIGTVIGDIEQVGVLVTRVRTMWNEEAVIPNLTILQAEVTNFSAYAREGGYLMHVRAGIGYDVPWRQVEAMLLLAADRTPRVKREPRPFVLQRDLANYSVNYDLCVYSDEPRAMFELYTELHRNVLDVFNEFGVQIMTPSYMGDPHDAKVVPREKWYEAPSPVQGPSARAK